LQFLNKIILGDCLEVMKDIPDNSIDMILCDLPYGTTQCKWDTIIDLEELWCHYNRIAKINAAKVLTSAQPFTTTLIKSNIKEFKYNWIWEKSKATGYLNPQMWQGTPYNKGKAHRPTDVYGKQTSILVKNDTGLRYPRTVQYFKTAESEGKVLHPTQKPLALFEYLIKTYTNEKAVVLDSCIGAGTTAIAAKKNNRNFIGIELDEEFYNIACKRLETSESK